MTFTQDSSYWLPLRCRITLKSRDGASTLFTYNSFSGSNPIKLTSLVVENAVGEHGTVTITVNDNEGILADLDLRTCKAYIELGKTEATLQHFLIAYCNVFNTARPQTRFKEYQIFGIGTQRKASDLLIEKIMASKIQNIDDPTVKPDSTFNINNLAKAAIEGRSWRPLRDASVQEQTGWLTTGISDKVNINFPVVNARFIYLSDFLDQLCSVAGAVWFIDYSSGQEIFTMTYKPELHTGVTIKSGDLQNRAADDADLTSYIKTAFTVEDAATMDAGHATRLYTVTNIDQSTVSSSFENKGSTTLDFKAIAQQVIIDSDARRLDSIALVLSKVGEPDSPKSRINGDICLDSGNKPKGTILDTFSIDLSSIEPQPETIFVNDINIKESLLEGGQKKIWLRLFQRSGTDGQPQHDPANTIRWHHDGVFNSSPVLATYSGTAQEGDRDKEASLSWSVTNLGPTYTYSIFSNIRRLQARTNRTAVDVYGMKEVFLPSDFLTDPKQIAPFLSLELAERSKARRALSEFQAWVPNNYLFRPHQIVSFADGLSGITQDFMVQRVRYAIEGDIGTLHANIVLGGLYNALLNSCSCV